MKNMDRLHESGSKKNPKCCDTERLATRKRSNIILTNLAPDIIPASMYGAVSLIQNFVRV